MNTLTTEGDRSGVQTPTRLEKAQNCMVAASTFLRIANVTIVDRETLRRHLDQARDRLDTAQRLLDSEQ